MMFFFVSEYHGHNSPDVGEGDSGLLPVYGGLLPGYDGLHAHYV